jgi:hypothetical protein
MFLFGIQAKRKAPEIISGAFCGFGGALQLPQSAVELLVRDQVELSPQVTF